MDDLGRRCLLKIYISNSFFFFCVVVRSVEQDGVGVSHTLGSIPLKILNGFTLLVTNHHGFIMVAVGRKKLPISTMS
jgi:hypothetical protein